MRRTRYDIDEDDDGGQVLTSFLLDRTSRRLLRSFAAANRMSMSEVIRQGIRTVCEARPAT